MSHAGASPARAFQRVRAQPYALRMPEYAVATAIFAASRAIVLLTILFLVKLIPANDMPGAWNDGSALWQYLLRWDSGWYLAIMRDGYHYQAGATVQQTVAFFPLYPALSWCVAKLLGLRLSAAALLVSNAASVAAVLLLYQYVREQHGAPIAYGAVALFSFFPASLFLSAAYAEPLAMALMMASLLDLSRGRWVRSALWCGLLTGARPNGIAMLAPVAYCMWPRGGWTRAAAMRLLLALAIGCSGLAVFALYLGLKFDAPLAFATAERAWTGGSQWSLGAGIHSFAGLANLFRGFPLPFALDPWMFVAFAGLILWKRSQLNSVELLFAGASFLILVTTRLCAGHEFGSMSRDLVPLFPAYIAASSLLERRPRLAVELCVCMAIGLAWYSVLFAQWHWVD